MNIKDNAAKILIIDNDKEQMAIFEKLLTEYHLTKCYTGKEAIDALQKTTFELTIIELNLTGRYSSYEIFEYCLHNSAKWLITASPNQNINYILGKETIGSLERFFKNKGFDGFIDKSFLITELQNKVKELLTKT